MGSLDKIALHHSPNACFLTVGITSIATLMICGLAGCDVSSNNQPNAKSDNPIIQPVPSSHGKKEETNMHGDPVPTKGTYQGDGRDQNPGQRVVQFRLNRGGPQPFIYAELLAHALKNGMRSEVMLGSIAEGEDEITPENWRTNPAFVQFLHEVVKAVAPHDPTLKATVQGKTDMRVIISDLRNPDHEQGPIPPEDIIGVFEVLDGKIVPESYIPNPTYRVMTEHLWPRLPPFIHKALIAAMKGEWQLENCSGMSN